VRIAEADPAAKSSRIVRMSAAAEQFTRRVALSEPTILFAHRGSNDPTTEGWRLIRGKGLEPAQPDFRMGPVADDGTAAWMFHGPGGGKLAYFTLAKQEGLTRELVEEANEKGWVLRARVWMNPQNPVPTGEFKGVCHFHYRDDDRVWILHPGIDRQGNQTLVVCRDSSLGYDAIVPIPGSREQYVDYEIRYKPSSKTADVFANGRLIATDFASIDRGSPSLRFGMWTPPGEVRFASLEWGILRDSSEQRLDETSDLGGKR